MATVVAKQPNWQVLPLTHSTPWYDSNGVRRVAYTGFALLGTAFASTAYYVSSLLPRLLLGALSAASFLVAQKIFSAPFYDPSKPLDQRVQAGKEIEASGAYKDFGTKYRDLLSQNILLGTDIDFFIERDVQVLNYADFMAKHADQEQKEHLILKLQPSSRELLRSKCLVLFADRSQSPDKVDQQLIKNFYSHDKIVTDNQKALAAMDWDAFTGDPKKVTDPVALERLKSHFLYKAQKREVRPTDVNRFPDEAKDSIQQTMIIFELELVADGKLPVSGLLWSSADNEAIAAQISKVSPDKVEALKQKLREYYLANPSRLALKSVGFKEIREACGMTLEMVDEASGSIHSDCRDLPYLGDNGFRKKYTTDALTDGSLTEELKEKIRVELRAAVSEAYAIEVEYYGDLVSLKLIDEVLIPRWQKMPFLDIWKNEQALFLRYCNSKTDAAQLFKPQIIEGIKDQSIFEIDSTILSRFLQPIDKSANGQTFAELAEEAVRKAGKLNKLVYQETDGWGRSQNHYLVDYLKRFFQTKLLDLTSPALREVLRKSMEEDGEKVFAIASGSYEPIPIWKKLVEAWSLFDERIRAHHYVRCEEVKKAQETLRQETRNNDDKKLVSETQKARQEASELARRLKEACRQKKDELYRKDTLEIHGKLGFKAREVRQKQQTISTLQSELRGLSELKKGLEAQIAALEAKTAPDAKRFIQLTQDVQFLKANPQPELAAKEQELFQMKEQFEILAQSRELIGLIRQRLADIPARVENCKAAISQAEQELAPLVIEQVQLQQQIDAIKHERESLEQEYQKLDRAYQKAHYEMNENPEIRAFNLDKKKRKAELQNNYDAFVQRQLEEFKELLGISQK